MININDKGKSIWVTPHFADFKTPTEPTHGEVAIVNNITAEVIFEWSDKIVAEADENNSPVEYKSGYIMRILPQTIIYEPVHRYRITKGFAAPDITQN